MKLGATKVGDKQGLDEAQILVIGYGNTLRRDDGAGVALAEKLAGYWSDHGIFARLIVSTQLVPEMTDELAEDGIEAVVFVDATSLGSAPAMQISRVELDTTSPSSGHHLDPATLLLYSALLCRRYPRAWLVTIGGVDFAHGEGLSDETNKWLTDVPLIADQLLTEMNEAGLCMNLQLPND